MILTVMVTQEDIDKGVKCESKKCAVALALARTLNTEEASVGGWGSMGDALSYRINYQVLDGQRTRVQQFIDAFDQGEAVSPIEFEIEPARTYYEDIA